MRRPPPPPPPHRIPTGAILACILCLTAAFHPAFASASPLRERTILVDAGHGAVNFAHHIINPGKKTEDGVWEHRLNVDIAERLARMLEEDGARVIMTRTGRDYWRMSYSPVEDNKNRALLANQRGAEALISVHCDWHTRPAIHGVTTLYANRASRPLAVTVQQHLARALQTRDRSAVLNTFTILDHAEMPAVIVEAGFMSHVGEGAQLQTAAYQERVARAIADGLRAYFATR